MIFYVAITGGYDIVFLPDEKERRDMVKVGDKVVVVSAPEYNSVHVGDVLTACFVDNGLGFWAEDFNGLRYYVKTEEMKGCAFIIVRPYTESEAERRGAKFGVSGVNKITGHKVTFVTENGGVNPLGENLWEFLDNDINATVQIHPSNIRLDHEPEFVAWEDAPEELKYDASRVYYRGALVDWIAKPEGKQSPKVVYMMCDGNIQFLTGGLMVKL